MSSPLFHLSLGALFLIVNFLGCDSSDKKWDRKSVRGEVVIKETTEAAEVNGSMSFLQAAGLNGPAASTEVVAGQYNFDATNGPIAGEHDVFVRLERPASLNQLPSSG